MMESVVLPESDTQNILGTDDYDLGATRNSESVTLVKLPALNDNK